MKQFDLEKLLKNTQKPEFKPFFSTRVLGKLERYQSSAVLAPTAAWLSRC